MIGSFWEHCRVIRPYEKPYLRTFESNGLGTVDLSCDFGAPATNALLGEAHD